MRIKIQHFSLCIVALLCLRTALALSSTTRKVCVIGATGKLGRETILLLSKLDIPVKCLLRHDISSLSPPLSLAQAESSRQVAAYLSTLPGVEMVQGDVSRTESLEQLMQDCTDCLALFGPVAPKPFFRGLFPFLYPESTPTHPKQINYEGVRNIVQAMDASQSCKRLVRITGKGETPWSIFSILINVFGGMAKGWNYEGEQLLRKSSVDYTIVRPGILTDGSIDEGMVLGVKDNGRDMKVTPVTYSQIAKLCIDSLSYGNCKRATLTAMNVVKGKEERLTLLNVEPDSREFPTNLMAEHRKAARVGGLSIIAMSALFIQVLANFTTGVFKWIVRMVATRSKI